MTFSKILEKRGSKEIGLSFLGSVLQPFLNRAINLAILKGSGKVEVEIDRLMSCVRGAANKSAPSMGAYQYQELSLH